MAITLTNLNKIAHLQTSFANMHFQISIQWVICNWLSANIFDNFVDQNENFSDFIGGTVRERNGTHTHKIFLGKIILDML